MGEQAERLARSEAPVGRLEAVILDMDGVLIDSEMWSWQAHNAALADHGLAPLTLDDIRRLVGLDGEDEWEALVAMRAMPDARLPYTRLHREAFIALRDRGLAPMPGVRDVLTTAQRLGLRLAVASNSPLPSISATLRGLGIRSFFGAVASGHEVARGKPHPDVYRLALERLGVDATHAIAVEDSFAGLTAARAAGLYAVAVPNELTAAQDLSAAHQRFSSLGEVAAWLPGASVR